MTSSTLATKFGRLLISTLPPVVLLTMLSTVADGQVIDKDTQAKAISVKPQTSGRPQAKATSVKPQAKANAPSLLAPSEVPSQKKTGDTGAVDVEATSGSYRLETGLIKTPSGALSLRIKRVPELRCPELRSPPHGL